jgi:hydroxymethylglutaryl-CoA synthase
MLPYFSGFHKKTLTERQEMIKALHPNIDTRLFNGELAPAKANLMIENCIGMLPLPVGLGFYFKVNGREFTVPMCVEEPSVVAAASNAAKLIASFGGFEATCTPPIMMGQIQLLDVDPGLVAEAVQRYKATLIETANSKYCYRMKERGGGVTDIEVRALSAVMSVVEVHINVCDAMGANIVNAVCEKLSHDVLTVVGTGRTGLRILSNYCTRRLVRASFSVPVAALGSKSVAGQVTGEEVAQRMLEALEFAKLDVYRATTHNKGVMNGIDSVAIAAGQDFRAIESAAHTWASRSGKYQPLTNYWVTADHFCGEIELPLSLGTKGGVLSSNPIYSATFQLLGFPTASVLSELIACVGLACNFAALRAMVTDGIQRGHMSLHARNLALAAGVPEALVTEVVEYMKHRDDITVSSAADYMRAHDLHTSMLPNPLQQRSLSTLYVHLPELTPHIKLNLAFWCPDLPSVHLSIEPSERRQTDFQRHITENLLGGKHSHPWVLNFMQTLDKVSYKPLNPRTNTALIQTLKLLGVLVSLASTQLLMRCQTDLIERAFELITSQEVGVLHSFIRHPSIPPYAVIGLCLLKELWQVSTYHLDSWYSSTVPESRHLVTELKLELQTVLFSNLETYKHPQLTFEELVGFRKKQMCATFMFLCDCLGASPLTSELMSQLKVLGGVVELLSTAARDLKKAGESAAVRPNLYLTWLSQSNSKDSDIERMHFIVAVAKLTEEATRTLANTPYTQYLERAAKALESYYHLNAKL